MPALFVARLGTVPLVLGMSGVRVVRSVAGLVASAALVTAAVRAVRSVAGALGVGVHAVGDVDGVRQHIGDGVEDLVDCLGVARQIDDQRAAAAAGSGAREHG